ncbi:MAG: phosphoadenylyl-sulfate reductase [Actinomycetota bacterium]|nr:phosphoadenylyl-sulfate reductase [Actinomycetota bacterium]
MTALIEPGLTYSPREMRSLVQHAAAEFEGADATHVLAWAATIFGRGLAVAASMQDAVVPHLVSQAIPNVDVLFIDTGYHFPETLQARDLVARRLPITVVTLMPSRTVAEQDALLGAELHQRDPDTCCLLRKVNPLAEALQGYKAWVGGGRRVDSPTRASLPTVSWDSAHDMVKISPIVAWSDADVEAYQESHGLPRHPLTGDGFPSIGCAPCTRRVQPGEDARAGRWAGHAKTECGIYG